MLDTQKYNALDLAQPTNFRAMLQSGELLWGTACRIPHEEAARIVATLPHHFCFIDAVSFLAEVQVPREAEWESKGTCSTERDFARKSDQDCSIYFQWFDGSVCPDSGKLF